MAFAGDGDAYNEGISHLVHAARRNIDITTLIHNNKVYALTTGQFTPTSPKGFKSKSAPEGSVEEPLNPLEFLISSKASFVARGFSGEREHLEKLLKKAINHPGFAVIDVLQPSVAFYNTWDHYNEVVYDLKKDDHNPKNREQALKKSIINENKEKIPIGVFYKEKRKTFSEQVLGKQKPVEEKERKIDSVIKKLK